MGTWGAGSFENDTAMDWACEVGSITDIESVFNSLAQRDLTAQIDVDEAARVIAAAEAVAVLMGRAAAGVPEDLQARLAGLETSPQLIVNAKHSLEIVLTDSELVDLWAEGDAEEWNIAMTGLIDRLDPALPHDPPPPLDEIEKRSGYLTRCVFCDGEFAEGEVFNLEFRDYSNDDGLYMSRGIYCHLACLNAKLHPRHLLQVWRYHPDEPPPFANLTKG
jgi:Domain of unknown function (DUF4259)